jgi:hypothetical protein
MVHSSKLTFVNNDNNLTGVGLTPGETICFGSLEFTADRFGNLSLSPFPLRRHICKNGAQWVAISTYHPRGFLR